MLSGDAPVTPPRLRRAAASAYLLEKHGLSFTVSTLATFATRGGDGPRYQLVGRVPYYPTAELDSFAARRLGALVSNSTEAKAQSSSGRAEAA